MLTATLPAKVFGAGGVLGIIALIIGGSVVGRSAKKAAELSTKIAAMPEKQRGPAIAEVQALRKKMVTFGNVVIVLLAITITLMAIGHYV